MKRFIFFAGILFSLLLVLSPERKPETSASVAQDEPVTFNKQIVRIFQKNCQTCHHPGDIAPFSLMTYRDALPYARLIRQKTQDRQMPPWKPVSGCGEFLDENRLTDEEIRTIARWVDQGAPEGAPQDLPEPLNFTDGWAMGEPDLVLAPDEEYEPPQGDDTLRCFTIPANLRGDRFISAIEVRPGNRRIVHHVLAFVDAKGISAQLDEADPGPGYTSFGGPGFDPDATLGGWAPGVRPIVYPEGVGAKVAANARIVIQVHYHPNGSRETDRTLLGIHFARSPVKKNLYLLPIANTRFVIPAGAKRHEVTASFTAPPFVNSHAIFIAPHMHLLGREIKVEVTYPDRRTACLIHIDDWDFDWQAVYTFKKPIAIPGGTRVNLTAYYDNSADNPRNPNSPPKDVRWGEQTTDEMCLAFIGFTLDAEQLPTSSPQVTAVSINAKGRLVVTGENFLPGADIEIDGNLLRDSRNNKKKPTTKLISNEEWRLFAPAGKQVSVNVLNTDGVRSTPVTFISQ